MCSTLHHLLTSLYLNADECHTRLHSKYWVMAFGLRNYNFLDDRFRICPGISTIGKFSSVHCSFPRVKLPSRIMWLRGSKKSSQVKKKTINWKIEAIRGTKKWFEDKSFSMRLPSLLKKFLNFSKLLKMCNFFICIMCNFFSLYDDLFRGVNWAKLEITNKWTLLPYSHILLYWLIMHNNNDGLQKQC